MQEFKEEEQLKFWKNKENKKWHCAVPRDDFATQMGFHWKKYGLIGVGKDKKAALEDWRSWKRASEFVSSIY